MYVICKNKLIYISERGNISSNIVLQQAQNRSFYLGRTIYGQFISGATERLLYGNRDHKWR